MARDITTAVKNHVAGSQVRGAVTLVRLAYDSGTTLLNSSDRDIVYDSETYLGVGDHGSVTAIEESSQLQANGISLTLSGIDTTLISDALNEDYQGRDARVYMCFFDSDWSLIADPLLIFRGRMDTQDISLGQNASISLTIESRLIDWERPRVRRYNNEDQQNAYSGDKGLEFVAQMVEKEIIWPGIEARKE